MRRIDLIAADDVPEGTMQMTYVDGTDQVLVINNGGEFTAVQGVCSHEYFELDKGFLTAGTLTCALHLSRFDLSDGEPLDPPAEDVDHPSFAIGRRPEMPDVGELGVDGEDRCLRDHDHRAVLAAVAAARPRYLTLPGMTPK